MYCSCAHRVRDMQHTAVARARNADSPAANSRPARQEVCIERLEAAARRRPRTAWGTQPPGTARARRPAPPRAALVPVRVRDVGDAFSGRLVESLHPMQCAHGLLPPLNVPYSPCSRGLGHLPRREMTYTRCACRLRGSVEYQQAFTEDGQRLCMVCLGPVTTCTAPAQVASSPRLLCTGMRKPLPPLTLMAPSLHRMYQQVPGRHPSSRHHYGSALRRHRADSRVHNAMLLPGQEVLEGAAGLIGGPECEGKGCCAAAPAACAGPSSSWSAACANCASWTVRRWSAACGALFAMEPHRAQHIARISCCHSR